MVWFTADGEIQDLWFEKAQHYAEKGGLKGWPRVKYRGPFPQTPEAPGGDETSSDLDKSSPVDDEAAGKDGSEKGQEEGRERKQRPVKEAADQADEEKRIGGPEAGKGSGKQFEHSQMRSRPSSVRKVTAQRIRPNGEHESGSSS